MGSIDGRRPSRWGLSLAALLAIGAAAPRAQAGTAEDEARARKLFEQADALGNDGKWKEACQVFQASYDIYPTGGTAFRTADCYDKINAWEKAVPLYQWVVDHRATDKRQDRVTLAEQRLVALTKLLAAQKAPVQQGPVQQRREEPPPPPKPNRVPAYVAFGVGGASAVAGAIFGGLALMQAGDIKSQCKNDPTCPGHPNIGDDVSAAKAKAWVSNVTIGVAVVGVATGAVLYALGLPKASSTVTSALGPRGITLSF